MPLESDVLHILESYAGSAIRVGEPADDALLQLLVRMAFADGTIDEGELAMLRGVLPLPDDDALRSWIQRTLYAAPDFSHLAEAFDTDDRRWLALRFAARMAARDGRLADPEHHLLEALAADLHLPPRALDRVLREMHGPPPELLEPEALRGLLDGLNWDATMAAEGGVASDDLLGVVPAGARPVLRVGVDQAEVLGIYCEGVAGRFLEGPAFLTWRSIVGCGRGEGLESSVRLYTDDGRIWSLIDARLGAIRLLIDRLYRAGDEPTSRPAPVIQRLASPSTTFDGSEA
jgi:uncharacterized tellurite resistance protein B-like protein